MYSSHGYLYFELLIEPIRDRISLVCSRDCKLNGEVLIYFKRKAMKTGICIGVLVRYSARDLEIILLTAILLHPPKHNTWGEVSAKTNGDLQDAFWVWV